MRLLWRVRYPKAGLPHGAVPVGAGVYGTTGRLEKCYRAYGAELEGEYNVVEAGMAWGRVKAADFVGKEAHVRHREQPQAVAMCTLTVDDHTSASGVKRYMLGGEPLLTTDGDAISDAHGRRSCRCYRRARTRGCPASGRSCPGDGHSRSWRCHGYRRPRTRPRPRCQSRARHGRRCPGMVFMPMRQDGALERHRADSSDEL